MTAADPGRPERPGIHAFPEGIHLDQSRISPAQLAPWQVASEGAI
ncbi:MAG TPA: hypothetical protein VNT33_09975 [Telluria sp.]|nr:hypothetical protein [Telluria sp.]